MAVGVVQTMKTRTANLALIIARTLVVDSRKTIAFTMNLPTRTTHRVRSAPVPAFEGDLRLTDAIHATPDKCCANGLSKPESDRSDCCEPSANGDEDGKAAGKCIPDGVNGCRRAALLKSTCCGPSIPGTTFWYLLSEITQSERL